MVNSILSPNQALQDFAQLLLGFFNFSLPLLLLAISGASIVIAWVIKVLLQILAARLSWLGSKSFSFWDEVAARCLKDIRIWVVAILIFNAMVSTLALSPILSKILGVVVVLSIAYQLAVWSFNLVRYWKSAILDKRIQNEPSSAAALSLFYKFVQAGILIAITLLALSNLGINIGAVIAGLGIGGIAVALAAQNVLGDLLASLSIVLDRPFVVGDFIVAGNERGTIEYIGIKTTRLRSLSGEEVVLSNKDLLESRIHNFKRMWRRRVVQKFGVVYSTPAHQLEMIPTWVKEIVTSKMQVQFDRCHFFEYADSSLNYELVFFVDNPEYNFFMDIQQSILIDIFKKFSSEKVSFAYPSQSLYIEKVTSMV